MQIKSFAHKERSEQGHEVVNILEGIFDMFFTLGLKCVDE